jgi:hypothetical protein
MAGQRAYKPEVGQSAIFSGWQRTTLCVLFVVPFHQGRTRVKTEYMIKTAKRLSTQTKCANRDESKIFLLAVPTRASSGAQRTLLSGVLIVFLFKKAEKQEKKR